MSDLKCMGGVIPTIFDLPEVWRLNRRDNGSWFNIVFFWFYPIVAILLLPFTILCLIGRWIGKQP